MLQLTDWDRFAFIFNQTDEGSNCTIILDFSSYLSWCRSAPLVGCKYLNFSQSGKLSVRKIRSVTPWHPQPWIHILNRNLHCYVTGGPQSTLPLQFFSNENWVSFPFFQHAYVIICKTYQKWTMRYNRATHKQFNEVFTDNSNCQILVPNDIVQSAAAHNCLFPSSSLPPR